MDLIRVGLLAEPVGSVTKPTGLYADGKDRAVADLLFQKCHLESSLTGQDRALQDEVNSLSEDRVLNTSLEDLCNYFVEKYRIVAPEIDESGIQVEYGDAKINVRGRFDYDLFGTGGPVYVTGTKITFYVPFTGDHELFYCQPSKFTLSPPRAAVRANELVFAIERAAEHADAIPSEFDREKNNVKEYLEWIARDVEPFNSSIREKASERIGARRQKLLRDRGLVEKLGFPIRRSNDMPPTYVSPNVQRRVAPRLPPVSTEPYMPEPTLDMDEYEHILSVISNMVSVMERSPRAFKGMVEEDLRTHFLVQLNGHYEGQATGETFNYEGKTDILIRAEDRNIFIAECKFWSGPSGLRDALDQMLGYISWRDTKTALLMFNRDRSMSTVLKKIPEVAKAHPNYKADHAYDSETGFRYIFGHRDDVNREIKLTVLAFDVPA